MLTGAPYPKPRPDPRTHPPSPEFCQVSARSNLSQLDHSGPTLYEITCSTKVTLYRSLMVAGRHGFVRLRHCASGEPRQVCPRQRRLVLGARCGGAGLGPGHEHPAVLSRLHVKKQNREKNTKGRPDRRATTSPKMVCCQLVPLALNYQEKKSEFATTITPQKKKKKKKATNLLCVSSATLM